MKKRRQTNAWLRAGIQAFFFLAMPGAFMAAFSGVKNIFEHISNGSVLEPNSFVLALLGLGGFTILFGRFFCGFACAFGSLGDAIYFLSGLVQKKILKKKKQYQLPESCYRFLSKLKYVLLASIVIASGTGYYSKLNAYNWNPWSVFSFFAAFQFHLNGYKIGAVLLVLIMIGMALKDRFFCQFLCPMGAVFAILPQLPWASLQRDTENCIKGCSACKRVCPVGIKLEQDGFLNGECIACEKCAGICPKGNLTRWDRKLLKNEKLVVIIKAVLLFVMGIALGLVRFL